MSKIKLYDRNESPYVSAEDTDGTMWVRINEDDTCELCGQGFSEGWENLETGQRVGRECVSFPKE